ncbi:MAG: phospholipid/glycerol acyltransferase, partial [Ilumatobacteraceae bacterium]|nr:phospholipid/glycerol acyltransferase [Ilumatobacteraceae bacterium]
PALLFVRHASLADSLVSAHVIVNLAGMNPRFVLKRELLADPCLDIVGQRVPNHFLDRDANDSAPELAALRALVGDMGPRDIGVIFPEGTRANPAKRLSALARIADRDPARAERMSALRQLLPPRPSGARAMVDGAPDADVVLAWHIGFEGLDTFGGILRALNRGVDPICFVARRVPAADVPRDDAFAGWLDEQWLRMDAEVDLALAARRKGG